MLDKDGFEKVIRPHARRFHNCWDRASRTYAKMMADNPDLMGRLSPRAISAIIYDLMANEIRHEFYLKPTPGVHIHERYGRVCVNIEGKVVLRFKKLDDKLRARYLPTNEARRFFEDQLAIIEVPDDSTNIICGYKKDEFGNTGGLYYTCPVKGGNAFVMEAGLFGEDEDDGGNTVNLPIPSGPKAPVIVPKNIPSERKEEKRDAV